MRKLFALAFVALFGLAGIALAQAPLIYQPGTLSLPTLTGAERVQVGNGGPQITTATTAQMRDAGGYMLVQAPASGSTVQGANNQSLLGLYPTATLAALTVNFPLAPFDAQRFQVFSSQAITALSLTSTSGQTISAPATSLGASGSIEYVYQASTTTWFRIQ